MIINFIISFIIKTSIMFARVSIIKFSIMNLIMFRYTLNMMCRIRYNINTGNWISPTYSIIQNTMFYNTKIILKFYFVLVLCMLFILLYYIYYIIYFNLKNNTIYFVYSIIFYLKIQSFYIFYLYTTYINKIYKSYCLALFFKQCSFQCL